MTAQTLQQMQERLALYVAAEARILEGQSYRIDTGGSSRSLTRADLTAVQAEIRRLSGEIAVMTAIIGPRRRRAYMVPCG